MTVFVSGHLDLTQKEFEEYYIAPLLYAVDQGYSFVVGDARGADSKAQKYLESKGADITIYHMFDFPRHSVFGAKLIGGFQNDDERDAAMTLNSDYDIAWVRPGREGSGTHKNLLRRSKK